MLKKILSISGRPGLYKLISYGKNVVVVESLVDGKRIPAHSRDRIVALGDISIYTTEEDKPLSEVLQAAYDHLGGKTIKKEQYKEDGDLDALMAKILPSYDVDRVHRSDIRKLFSWYNILVAAGFSDFTAKEDEEEKKADTPAAKEEKKADEPEPVAKEDKKK